MDMGFWECNGNGKKATGQRVQENFRVFVEHPLTLHSLRSVVYSLHTSVYTPVVLACDQVILSSY